MENTAPTTQQPVAPAPAPQAPPAAAPSSAKPTTPPAPKKKTLWYLIGALLVLAVGAVVFFLFQQKPAPQVQENESAKQETPAASPTLPVHPLIGSATAPVKLVYAIHWTEQLQTDGIFENGVLKSKGLKQYLEEYVKLHPEVAFQIQVINYSDYAKKLQLLSDAGVPPDIYQIYAPWGVSYVKNNVLAEPPAAVVSDVKTSYVSNAGATIDGKIWGFPTEVNTYALVYNKDIFKAAGISAPPVTFAEFVETAKKLTKYDANGNITQYGVAFLKGNDWQVVDPFLSWLYSNNGSYLSPDLSTALFNTPQGKEVLEGELELFTQKSTDNNGNVFDFSKGKVAMAVIPPWLKNIFKNEFKDKFETTVGVAPLPYFEKPSTLQYSWFMGVMAKSKYQKEAWDFLTWFNTDVQSVTNTTRNGDLLANTIGAIPSRKVDIDNHSDVLTDFFTKTFVDQIKTSVSEPNVLNADVIKKTLMTQIEAVWAQQKTPDAALQQASTEVNAILDNQ